MAMIWPLRELDMATDFKKILKIAREIRAAYDELNRKKGKEVWKVSDYGQGLVGDVGDLIKFLASYTKNPTKDGYKKISHELGDCLWSLIAIAQELDIDIEKEFLINMEYLKQKFYEKTR